MGLLEIDHFDVLVHPDSCWMNFPNRPLHPFRERLHQQWDLRVGILEERPTSGLIYITYLPLSIRQVLKGLPQPESNQNSIQRDELLRITRYSNIMQDRFFLLAKQGFQEYSDLYPETSVLIKSKIHYDPATTILAVYGELFECCVYEFGQALKDNLGLCLGNLHYLSFISLTKEQHEGILIDTAIKAKDRQLVVAGH